MYIKNYKGFLPEEYTKKVNKSKSKMLVQGFIVLAIFNLTLLAINLNLAENIKSKEKNKQVSNFNNIEISNLKNIMNNEILKAKNILSYDKIESLSIKDKKINFKVKEENLWEAIDNFKDYSEVINLTYLIDENMVQGEGNFK